MTYAVVAPEHPLLDALTTEEHRAAVEELRRRAAVTSDIDRTIESELGSLDKRGAFTGSRVINPFTGTPHGLRHRRHHGGSGRGRA
jgi:leucyl-tRNA synthetase